MRRPKLGDYGVVATGGFWPRVIRLVTRSSVNHAVLYIGSGQIVEGEPDGARIVDWREYGDAVRWSSVQLTRPQREAIAAWGRKHEGTPYNWIDDLAIGLVDVFGWAPKFLRDRLKSTDRLMCSQLVDAAYDAAGVDLFTDGRPVGGVSPGDLAELLPGGTR
jgi:uncharacterized protein YycO